LSGWLVSWLVGWLVGFLVVKREGIQPVKHFFWIYTSIYLSRNRSQGILCCDEKKSTSAGFKPVILATKWSQTYALDLADNGIGILSFCPLLDLDDHTKGRSKKRTNAPRGAWIYICSYVFSCVPLSCGVRAACDVWQRLLFVDDYKWWWPRNSFIIHEYVVTCSLAYIATTKK
jgi:hypothetical protein